MLEARVALWALTTVAHAVQQREVDIPANSMQVPEDAEEVEVVVDRQPATLRVVSAVSCALSLLVLTGVGMYERGAGQ